MNEQKNPETIPSNHLFENTKTSNLEQNNEGEIKCIHPQFNDLAMPDTFLNHISILKKKSKPTSHNLILKQLIIQFALVDFKKRIYYQSESQKKSEDDYQKSIEKFKVTSKHYLVLTIEEVVSKAIHNNWSLCKNQEFIYLYNGAYWAYIEKESFQKFLGEAAEAMGVPKFISRYYLFREQQLKQFLATQYLPTPVQPKDTVNINLQNGTFEITPFGTRIRPFDHNDFITYQLPFAYDPAAKAPIFQAFLDKVLPDKECQMVLAEFLGFVFIKHKSGVLKEEKALICYGLGANGKSVYFEVVHALLGFENVSTFSLQSLTDVNGYYRAMIANKLLNYASEINGNLETSFFKQLVSGEPVEARLPYGQPMQIKNYAKLMFNCNELPKDVEHTNAYFRRFLIIPFNVTIPEDEQDRQLHTKIIENELSGVFNWVLDGLDRLLKQKRFSPCEAAKKTLETYKTESDSVKLYLEENGYKESPIDYLLIKELFYEYRNFCIDDGFKAVQRVNFTKRLKGYNIKIERKNIGNVAFLSKVEIPY